MQSTKSRAMTPDAASASGPKRAACFTILPPEVRNKIYRYLFSLQDALVERWYPDFTEQYVFPVAILRTNRLLYKEARATLYSDNLLVLFDLDTIWCDVEDLFYLSGKKRPPFNAIYLEAPMPPAAVHIKYESKEGHDSSHRIVLAAADIGLVCHALHEMRLGVLGFYTDWLITVLKVPQHGWTSEKLSESIWEPLQYSRWDESNLVIDRTGVFETRAEESASEGSSDVQMDGDEDEDEDKMKMSMKMRMSDDADADGVLEEQRLVNERKEIEKEREA